MQNYIGVRFIPVSHGHKPGLHDAIVQELDGTGVGYALCEESSIQLITVEVQKNASIIDRLATLEAIADPGNRFADCVILTFVFRP